ncbi:MAG: PhoH family protein [Candidatus Dependentiae bacterium]|nr:PhoH family protein [Candidatus Dependentiae bacterium]
MAVRSKNQNKNQNLFVLDTNVLLHDPEAIFSFENAIVGIPIVALEELDKFKKEGTDRGRNCREVTRHLDALREKGSLRDGVTLDNGSIVKVLFLDKKPLNTSLDLDIKDNEIVMTAAVLKEQGYNVKFISKDLNARVKADVLGIQAEDYLKEHVTEEDFYKGWLKIQVPAVQLKQQVPQDLTDLVRDHALTLNEFVLVESQHNPFNYRVFRYLGGTHFKAVNDPQIRWPLKARNAQQLMALDLLFDDSIKLACLFGPAGTGKTFLALLAGLYNVLIEDDYSKLLISRPVVPLGRDIGYLPGTMEEKLHSWMLPVFDNMEFIMHSVNMATHFQELGNEQHQDRDKERGHDRGHDRDRDSKYRHKKGRHHDRHKEKSHKGGGLMSVQDLVHKGKLSMEAITYMRGRSIPYQYIIIDEVQNLTPHEVKTLITRVGEGSKIILAGDPYQIDSPYLDFSSNGLVIASERFKGQGIFGSVYLENSERSELSKIAGQLL